MGEVRNPWHPAGQVPAESTAHTFPLVETANGARGTRVPAWDEQVWGGEPPGWWWLATHGGAGVTTLSVLVPGGADAGGQWPLRRRTSGPAVVVLVCRTHLSGLLSVRDLVQGWRDQAGPQVPQIAGLVAVADAPGQLPEVQRQEMRLLAGVVSPVWPIPWIPEFRSAIPAQLATLPPPPQLVALSVALQRLRPVRATAGSWR
jgi:hypothetical protein